MQAAVFIVIINEYCVYLYVQCINIEVRTETN